MDDGVRAFFRDVAFGKRGAVKKYAHVDWEGWGALGAATAFFQDQTVN